MLTAWELYLRNAYADFYAIFEDDMVMCSGTKQYLESMAYPENSYLNLFTFATNEHKIFGKPQGWHLSDQLGKGAVALVFNRPAMMTLLKQSHFVDEPYRKRQFQNTDGAIQHAMTVQAGFKEYVHNPSLVQHIGLESTLGHSRHPEAKTFPGGNWNAAEEMKQ
jgi:GR25 family glycosyltransferase involved in LPS biosynthesis